MLTTISLHREGSEMRGMSELPTTPLDSIQVSVGGPLRTGVPVVNGYMPARALIPDNYVIPYFDPRTNQGYQRPLQESRVNELANDLRKQRVDLPTTILLNVRNREARNALNGGRLSLSYLRDGASTAALFYVVDGQHRVESLNKLIEEDPERWLNFLIPFVCMLGATEAEEMEQFYVVNSRAKPVRTDLAYNLLRRISDRDPKMLERLEEKGKAWQVLAEKLVEATAENSSVWRGLIRLPAMEKGHTTLPSASMVSSLKPLLSSTLFSRLVFAQQLQVLEAFWAGLREVMRPAFDDPEKFVIQKGVGVMVMHQILVDVLEVIRSGGQSVIEPASYHAIMRDPIEKLQGEAQDGSPAIGVDFWRTTPEGGAAGSYSSSAGRRVLISKIRHLLPTVEVI